MIRDTLIRRKAAGAYALGCKKVTDAYAVGCILLLSACVHGPHRPPPEEMAFPFGTYQHKVTATPTMKDKVPNVELNGVVQSQQHDLRVVGLSPVGSTLFRIHEDICEHKITKEFYVDQMKQHETHFMQLYDLIKDALYAPKGANQFTRHGAEFTLSQADAQGIPRLIEISHPYLKLKIEVTSYAP